MQRRPLGPILLVLLALAACVERKEAAPVAPESAAQGWTTAFLKEAVLVADEIRIEGPQDLLAHVAIQQDPEAVEYTTRTVSEGLLQELRVIDPQTQAQVQAQLDGWRLAAWKRLTILQRPGEVPVTVQATGEAMWAAADGSGERREATLTFQGRRAR